MIVFKKCLAILLCFLMLLVSACGAKGDKKAVPEKYYPPAVLGSSIDEVSELYADKVSSGKTELDFSLNDLPDDYKYAVSFYDTVYLDYCGETICIFNGEDDLTVFGFTAYLNDFSLNTFENNLTIFSEAFDKKPLINKASASFAGITTSEAYWLFTEESTQRRPCFCFISDQRVHTVSFIFFYGDVTPGSPVRAEEATLEKIAGLCYRALQGETR